MMPATRARLLLVVLFAASCLPLAAAAPEGEVVKALASQFFAAVDGGDINAVQAALTPTFVAIDPRGGTRTGSQYVSDLRASERLRAPAGAPLRRDWSSVRLITQEHGAIFIGRSTWRPVQVDDGRQPVGSLLYVLRWVRQDGQWRLDSMQTTWLGPPPEVVPFTSGALTLQAMLFRPAGKGPFPAIVYAHGNEPDPSDLFETVGPPLAQRGYLVFAPHRRGSGLSAAAAPNLLRTLTEVEQREGPAARARLAIAQLEGPHLDDMAAAITAVKQRPDVDPAQVFLIGNSFGGVLATLAAERGLGLAGAADFAGAALNWERSEEFRARMTLAASRARIPLFLGQAANDASTAPTTTLGAVLCGTGTPARAKVWPAYGVTIRDGHGFGVDAVHMWADEVLGFLRSPVPARDPQCAASSAARP